MNADLILFFLAGLVVTAALAVVFTRRISLMVFAFFSFLLGVGGIYAYLQLHMAFVAHLLLYVGGTMVLVAFAMHLYPEPDKRPGLHEARQALGKAALFIPLLIACFAFLPWKALWNWVEIQQGTQESVAAQDPVSIGQVLASDFLLEFEWLGVLMLLVLVLAGWYMKDESLRKQP